MADLVYTIDDIAELFKVSKRTIYGWRKTATFPKPLNLPGVQPRWAADDIQNYLEEMKA